MAFKQYDPRSLQIPGIKLPDWLYNVDPVSMEQADATQIALENNRLISEGNKLSNETKQEALDRRKKQTDTEEKLMTGISPDDLADREKYTKKALEILREAGDAESYVKMAQKEAERTASSPYAKVISSNGAIYGLDQTGKISMIPGSPSPKAAGGKKGSPMRTYYHTPDGQNISVDINDAASMARMESMGAIPGKAPTANDEIDRHILKGIKGDTLEEKSKAESESRAINPSDPVAEAKGFTKKLDESGKGLAETLGLANSKPKPVYLKRRK